MRRRRRPIARRRDHGWSGDPPPPGPGRIGERNGHIGYDVRPSARRKGHATAMLAAARPWVARLGLTGALITCDTDNLPSRRVIEANGGVLLDHLDEKLRFWFRTT